MHLLGIMITRNSGDRLSYQLDKMSEYCDGVYAINDRSTDNTRLILRSHALVKNEVTIPSELSSHPWYFDEGTLLNICYNLAELCKPDWIIRIDDDEELLGAHGVRRLLAELPPSVAAITFPRVSTWSDVEHPYMVPLMGKAISPQGGGFWRFQSDAFAAKRMHNPRIPTQLYSVGAVIEADSVSLIHDGWNTLKKRIERVDLYNHLDPKCDLNGGVPYDRGLLFGFQRSNITGLIAEYKKRLGSSS